MSSPSPALLEQNSPNHIRSQPCPNCYMCGAEGESLYQNLKDRYFGAPGIWTLKRCPDKSCGLVWLDPIPLKDDIGKAYETYFTHSDSSTITSSDRLAMRLKEGIRRGYLAHKYGYSGGRRLLGLLAYLFPFRRAGVDFSVMYLSNFPGGRLLEVGCGSGWMLKIMSDLGWHAEGVDFDGGAVAHGLQRGLRMRKGTLEDLRYEGGCFDAITMSHVIEHVHDPLGLLKECHRILKSGGRLSLVTPNIGSAAHRLLGSAWFHLDPPRHLRIFSARSFPTLMQKAGFRSVKIRTTIRDAAHAQRASLSIKRTGRYEWDSKQSLGARTWGQMMQVIEWALLATDRNAGEEIAVLAEK